MDAGVASSADTLTCRRSQIVFGVQGDDVLLCNFIDAGYSSNRRIAHAYLPPRGSQVLQIFTILLHLLCLRKGSGQAYPMEAEADSLLMS